MLATRVQGRYGGPETTSALGLHRRGPCVGCGVSEPISGCVTHTLAVTP